MRRHISIQRLQFNTEAGLHPKNGTVSPSKPPYCIPTLNEEGFPQQGLNYPKPRKGFPTGVITGDDGTGISSVDGTGPGMDRESHS